MLLVTGGAGFIGTHIVGALLRAGRDVRVLDLAPEAATSGADVVAGDVRDPSVVGRALDGVTAVCHQAARVGLGVGFGDVTGYVSHNDDGTAVLLQALAARRFGGRLVLASSMVVYGEGRYRCDEHGLVPAPPRRAEDLTAGRFEPACPRCGAPLAPEPVPEDAPVDPRNVYAATKLHQEHLAFAYGRECAVPVTALRYHNVYGPGMPRDTPYCGVAALFADALAAGEAPAVFEDGRQLRDFVHVRDVARANVAALTRDAPATGAYNIASGTPRSVGTLAERLAEAAGSAAPRPRVTGRFRLGDVRHVFAATRRAAEVLGFAATEDFDAGIDEVARVTLGFGAETVGT
jgi:dTDP-L-rhamnose 4-epimerase